MVCVCVWGGGGGEVGEGRVGGDRQINKQTGQIFNNCISDDTVKFSSVIFGDRTKTSWNVCLMQPRTS